MFNNSTFYPTPPLLASRMLAKVKGRPLRVLEPSAGKGDLVTAITEKWRYSGSGAPDVFAIEIDPTLQATLRGNQVKVIDADFLSYAGADKFDLICMNPPFDAGEAHLSKALDILYRGQVICLLNAETLRNPHTNTRKALVRRLDELGAEIEYIEYAFMQAERKTSVEIVMVNVVIDRKVEDDLFAGADDHATRCHETVQDKHEVSTGKTVEELVLEYLDVVRVGTETIVGYFRNYRKVGQYIGLNREASVHDSSGFKDLTDRLQGAVNALLRSVRHDYWRRTLDLKEVRSRLTAKKAAEFEHALADRCHMDFTESNIRAFVLNIIGGYEQTLTEALLEIFEMFTTKHCWHGDAMEKNIHYFNGWKTNKAFKVGKRVVVPVKCSYGNPFYGYSGLTLDYQARAQLRDIDLVISYLDGGDGCYSLVEAIDHAFKAGSKSGESSHFKFICHKKGTIHLTFTNMDVLRRFNVIACRGKGWLPGDFGAKAYEDMPVDEKAVVDEFEGAASYAKHRSDLLFRIADSQQLRLMA